MATAKETNQTLNDHLLECSKKSAEVHAELITMGGRLTSLEKSFGKSIKLLVDQNHATNLRLAKLEQTYKTLNEEVKMVKKLIYGLSFGIVGLIAVELIRGLV